MTDLTVVLQQALELQQDPTRFVSYYNRPVAFCEEVLGVKLWSRQQDIMNAVATKTRVAVRSGHGIGKTMAAACIVIWWLYARKGLVITTAPTWESVSTVLWREIHTRLRTAPTKFPGDHLQTDLKIDATWYATGLSTNMPSAFQGRHHEHLLAVVDEAPGVAEQVHLEISTLVTGSKNCIFMIGNPTALSGTFYDAFKHPDIWTCLRVSCLEHPNVLSGEELIPGAVTRGWVEERRAVWGEHHPLWSSRVLGDFPKISNKGVIPLGWCERAQNEEKRQFALAEAEAQRLPRVGGLDVARYGANRCVLTVRRGDAVELQESWGHSTIMETCGRAMRAIEDYDLRLLMIDAAGLGAGCYDRLNELGAPVMGYNGGHRAFTPATFANRRSEMWWALRTRLEKQRLWFPPDCEKLISELVTPEYDLASSGRIKVETKEALMDRGIPSPDHADSLILCFAMDENPEADLAPSLGVRQDPWAFNETNEPVMTFDFPQFPAGF